MIQSVTGPKNVVRGHFLEGRCQNLENETEIFITNGLECKKFYKAKLGGIINAKFCNYGKM